MYMHANEVVLCISFNGSFIHHKLLEIKNEKPIYAFHPVLMYNGDGGDCNCEQRLKLHIPMGT